MQTASHLKAEPLKLYTSLLLHSIDQGESLGEPRYLVGGWYSHCNGACEMGRILVTFANNAQISQSTWKV